MLRSLAIIALELSSCAGILLDTKSRSVSGVCEADANSALQCHSASPRRALVQLGIRKEASTAGVVEARWVPDDFVYSSCQQMPVHSIASMTLSLGMSVSKCFNHCAGVPGAKFFALARGRECHCGAVPLGDVVHASQCDVKCVGDPSKMCGGINNIASAYAMIDCDPPSPEEQQNEDAKRQANLINTYQVKEGRSCGHSADNSVKLDGSPVMAGSAQTCAAACWEARGAEECHGFTYDEIMDKCSFLSDVMDGEVTVKKSLKCYFKKIGFEVDL